jgi:hypothetical protein
MKQLISKALAIGLAVAWQPVAHAQFGSGIVFDPTQAGHAVTQIENEQRSLANEVRQIEQGQQIFTNTVKIATTALQAYNVAKQEFNLTHQMILAPRMLYARFLSPTSDLLLLHQISNTYGNSMGWLNSARQSPYSARIEFEKVYSNPSDHTELKRDRWTVSVTYVFREHVKNYELTVNPLGLTIVRFRADQAFR